MLDRRPPRLLDGPVASLLAARSRGLGGERRPKRNPGCIRAVESDVEAGHALSSSLGRITISSAVIAQIVGETALECYGVVGMSERGAVRRLIGREKVTRGIEIGRQGDGVAIDLHVVVEYGLNLAEVASTIRNRVGYEVRRLTGLPVASVEVHVDDVRHGE